MTVTALLCSISLAGSPHTQSLGFIPPHPPCEDNAERQRGLLKLLGHAAYTHTHFASGRALTATFNVSAFNVLRRATIRGAHVSID